MRISRDIFICDGLDEAYALAPKTYFLGPICITPGALGILTRSTILKCIKYVKIKARRLGGLYYIQVFYTPKKILLWLIDDGLFVTALLPVEY